MITEPEEFFAMGCGRCKRFATPDCSARRWADGLARLRRICLEAGLTETAKWGHPCYMHAGRNIALIGAFRDDFRLNFFDAALLSDPAGLLERQGKATRHPDTIRFTDSAGVDEAEAMIRALLDEAASRAANGERAPADARAEAELPAELVEAIEGDAELALAFHRLTPGRRRSHAIAVGSSRNPATRRARIARLRPRILAGKGATER